MDIPLLNDILKIFGVGVAVVFVCHYARIPAIVGLLLTGVLAGPHGWGLIHEVEQVEVLAEIGILTLLFTIGIDLSFAKLFQMRKAGLVSGPVQVGLAGAGGFLLGRAFGLEFGQALFVGFLLAPSSTIILLKIFQERSELHSPQGRTSLAVCIFQDIITVPMMLLVPILAGQNGGSAGSPWLILAEGIGIIIASLLAAKYVVPILLFHIVKTRSRELFLLTLIAICFGVAYLTSQIGLSLALGAFLAGLIVSESPYTQQALGDIMPFRDVFTSFFFVSVGMLLDVSFFLQNPLLILGLTFGVVAFKAIIAGFATLVIGYPVRTMVLVGAAMCQVGEFSFVLSRAGLKVGLLEPEVYQVFLTVSVATMALTPFIINQSPRLAAVVAGLPFAAVKRRRDVFEPPASLEQRLNDHLIIVGYGVNGRNLARAARSAGIDYVILEMNPVTVKNESQKGEPIYFGDATHKAVLEHIGIKNARVMVIAISDAIATRRIVGVARRMNRSTYLIARTRFLQEVKPLYKLGADEVIPEDFETSVEIFSRVLRKYLVSREEIENFVAEVRSDNYEMFRTLSQRSTSTSDLTLTLPDVDILILRVGEKSAAVGKTLGEIDMRQKYGVTLVAIRRSEKIFSNPGGDVKIDSADQLIILGKPEKLSGIRELIEG